ncbi:glycoside hydrolase family 9 protein [Streptomyces sp. ST2-7A]|uniref:glycoside hydrolase family 9 protein n=1 Tax=Streptomyces sp. ST2-7A TaxID=2907214 RepID=UPI001F491842|nr:glycoside hydrolase family 9 protein [Streptomyces sp. ST2-7A]MCE7082451.1 glycoside hydrolase family 9 protein [Streptomyces sp. ST2-7A]
MPSRPHHRRGRPATATVGLVLAALLPLHLATGTTAHANADPSPVRVNQVGYLTGADKIATVVSPSTVPLPWELRDGSGTVVASGTTEVRGHDAASGDHVHHADFSAVTTPGTHTLHVPGVGTSVAFRVEGSSLYPDLADEALNYFYFHRMGTPTEARHLRYPAHAHDALHPGDESVPCYQQWCGNERLNVRYSWADAGDFGIYAVNHAISAWTLLNLHERYPDAHPDGSLNIPESGNGRSDLVDEVEYGSRFMPGLLPSTGLASHKVHNHVWSAFPTSVAEENSQARSAQPPSTNATYAVARTTAHLARVLESDDPARAAELWESARDAWQRAESHPVLTYPHAPQADGGGDYGDSKTTDDRYAAAVELYLTAGALGDSSVSAYRSAVTGSPHYGEMGQFDWAEVAGAGTLSLLTVDNDLPAADLARMESNLRSFADSVIGVLGNEGYPAAIPGSSPYPWGSNSFIANRMLVLGTAHDVTGEADYLRAMHRAMDYLMGNNAMRLSYVTGYGAFAETDLHDRLAWGAYPGTPFPPGWLSGGPNNELINDNATPTGQPPAKSYAGPDTAPQAWGSKENTINWNAPLAWVATHLDRTAHELAADDGNGPGPGPGPGDTEPPTAPGTPTVSATTADSVTLSWSAATDNVGVTGYRVLLLDGGARTPVASVTGTTAVVTGLEPDTVHTFAVEARDAAGNVSPLSGSVTARTAPGGSGPGAACAVAYRLTSQWQGGFQAEVTLTNSGPITLSGWSLTWDFPGGESVSNMWGGTASQVGGRVTVSPMDYTANVPPGGSVTVGFVGSASGATGVPTAFALDGSACAVE